MSIRLDSQNQTMILEPGGDDGDKPPPPPPPPDVARWRDINPEKLEHINAWGSVNLNQTDAREISNSCS